MMAPVMTLLLHLIFGAVRSWTYFKLSAGGAVAPRTGRAHAV